MEDYTDMAATFFVFSCDDYFHFAFSVDDDDILCDLFEKYVKLNNIPKTLVAELTKKIDSSDNINYYYTYIKEVFDKCLTLVSKRKKRYAFTEIDLMFNNLRKQLNI